MFCPSAGVSPPTVYCFGPTATNCGPGATASAKTIVSLAVTVAPRRVATLFAGCTVNEWPAR